MATITELIRGKARISTKPLQVAHRVEYHWIRDKGSWEESARALAGLFPRETRVERPARWYGMLSQTHWPGCVPPGNGPFYVTEWILDDAAEGSLIRGGAGPGPFDQRMIDKARAVYEAELKKAGFRRIVAHVVVLPQDGEYLLAAMRAAGQHAWNADPILYRAYLYPTLAKRKRELREYTTERWRV